jgi:hypothetical protein
MKAQYKEILNLNNSPNILIFEFRMTDENTKGKNPPKWNFTIPAGQADTQNSSPVKQVRRTTNKQNRNICTQVA